jgi:hypothetical protein
MRSTTGHEADIDEDHIPQRLLRNVRVLAGLDEDAPVLIQAEYAQGDTRDG